MSIKRTRDSKALIADLKDVVRNDDISSCSVISVAHLQHVLAMRFFISKKGEQKLTHMCEKFAGKFNSVQVSAGRFFSVNYFNASKNGMKGIYLWLINAVHLKFEHVLSETGFGCESSFANKKAPVSINQSGKIDKIISRNFLHINHRTSLTHRNLQFIVSSDMVQYFVNYVNRDRLNEWDPKGYAIVEPT